MASRVVHLVPHTHWDREWYLPFQGFRLRLVGLIDRLLDSMEADERWVFTLDGQLATVDDYLEVRPEAEERIRQLVRAGRLAVGPWHVLMDEFLVSGESIVRNLELGLRRAEELGGAMRVGYLPDQFGHVAQMPQILRRAGLEHAVVWRGVPAEIDRHVFRWTAPDGSAVRAEYLPFGYGNAAHVLDIAERLAAKVQLLRAALEPFFGEDEILALYGTDHQAPAPELVEIVERTNAEQDDIHLVLNTLAGYFSQAPGTDTGQTRDRHGTVPQTWPRWKGELRSAARANLLPGVASARIDLKDACARAERLLERYAEPLQTLWGASWPGTLLDLAWRRVIENSAHDSICGCSADAVCRQVLVRFDEAEQIAAGLAQGAAESVARRAPHGSVAVVNPLPRAASDLVELDLAIPDEWEEVSLELPDGRLVATQEVGRSEVLLLARELPGRELPAFLGRRLHGRELFGRRLNGIRLDRDGERRRLTLEVGTEPDPLELDVAGLRNQVERAAATAPEEPWLVRVRARPGRTLQAIVPAPPLGWTAVRAARGGSRPDDAVYADGRRMEGASLEVEVASDGTLRIGRLEGIAQIVDGGDFGDSYNYAPPAVDALVDVPESVSVDVVAAGPLRAALAILRRYRWPVGLREDGSTRADDLAAIEVETRVELRAGEPFLRVHVAFDNRCRDHRVRLHLPLPQRATGSAAEGQFAVVERGLAPEGGYGEVPVPTFPARGFVAAGGLAVLLNHVLEYEVLEGRELALTLLRATGLISRNANPWREDPAGPEMPIPDAQLLGPRSVAFALMPYEGEWYMAGILEEMERYQHPFLTARGTGPTDLALAGEPGLEIAGEGVVLSSLRRRDDRAELRVVCQSPEPRSAVLSGAFGEARFELQPWEIRTLQLD